MLVYQRVNHQIWRAFPGLDSTCQGREAGWTSYSIPSDQPAHEMTCTRTNDLEMMWVATSTIRVRNFHNREIPTSNFLQLHRFWPRQIQKNTPNNHGILWSRKNLSNHIYIYSDGLKLRMPPCFSKFLTVPLRMPFFWPHLECLHR